MSAAHEHRRRPATQLSVGRGGEGRPALVARAEQAKGIALDPQGFENVEKTLAGDCKSGVDANREQRVEKMDRYRRSADRVREPQPSFDYVWTESAAIVKERPLEQR